MSFISAVPYYSTFGGGLGGMGLLGVGGLGVGAALSPYASYSRYGLANYVRPWHSGSIYGGYPYTGGYGYGGYGMGYGGWY